MRRTFRWAVSGVNALDSAASAAEGAVDAGFVGVKQGLVGAKQGAVRGGIRGLEIGGAVGAALGGIGGIVGKGVVFSGGVVAGPVVSALIVGTFVGVQAGWLGVKLGAVWGGLCGSGMNGAIENFLGFIDDLAWRAAVAAVRSRAVRFALGAVGSASGAARRGAKSAAVSFGAAASTGACVVVGAARRAARGAVSGARVGAMDGWSIGYRAGNILGSFGGNVVAGGTAVICGLASVPLGVCIGAFSGALGGVLGLNAVTRSPAFEVGVTEPRVNSVLAVAREQYQRERRAEMLGVEGRRRVMTPAERTVSEDASAPRAAYADPNAIRAPAAEGTESVTFGRFIPLATQFERSAYSAPGVGMQAARRPAGVEVDEDAQSDRTVPGIAPTRFRMSASRRASVVSRSRGRVLSGPHARRVEGGRRQRLVAGSEGLSRPSGR